jgi:hypothetical protein
MVLDLQGKNCIYKQRPGTGLHTHEKSTLGKMARDALALTKLQFLFTLLFYVIPHAALRMPSAIIRAWSKKLPLGPAIWNGFVGALMVNTPPKQLQAILPSTIDTYNAWVASRETVRAVDVLSADKFTRLLWIGPRRADKVILFFHGII